jgi:hypothetical protein
LVCFFGTAASLRKRAVGREAERFDLTELLDEAVADVVRTVEALQKEGLAGSMGSR